MRVFGIIEVPLSIENTHLPNSAVLFSLLQDFHSLGPNLVRCKNVTWDHRSYLVQV